MCRGAKPFAGSLRASLRHKSPPPWPGGGQRNGREGFFDTLPVSSLLETLMEGNGESEASDGRDVPWFNGDPDG